MSSVILLLAEPGSEPGLPKLGKVAAERRRRPLTVLFGVFIAAIIFCSQSRWPQTGIAREVFFVAGMLLACVGAFGRIWSNLFISGYKSRFLIQTGPYSICRNPLYFFSSIGMVGIGLTTETLSIPCLLIAFFAAYYPMIIGREERRLAQRHPEEFPLYCASTPAFWPRWRNYSEPESYTMQPRAMRKNLADAFWFVALAALVHAEAHLSHLIVVPASLSLW